MRGLNLTSPLRRLLPGQLRAESTGEFGRGSGHQENCRGSDSNCLPIRTTHRMHNRARTTGVWELGRRFCDWNSSELGDRYYGGGGYSCGTQQGERGYVERNSNSYNTTVLSPPPPQNWWQPCWAWPPTTSPGPSTQTCQPASPVYCDGCHSWGNLLAVTVTQARGL